MRRIYHNLRAKLMKINFKMIKHLQFNMALFKKPIEEYSKILA